MASCLCCAAVRPRYKILVDNIYPDTAEGSLVTSEMQKLTYYALSAPEKLDRIGDYLAHRLSRDLHKHRVAPVFVAMEALDQLLLACHAQQINLFVESFIKMVGELLESQNIEFQVLGTNSFVKFCQIEEDTPSYHRRYDFFVSKFSEMCYHSDRTPKSKDKSQWHGVKGIQGVIRKTVSDKLQVNIWEKQHMDKIMPSLLYVIMMNQKNSDKTESYSEQGSETSNNPAKLAEECLQELLSRATFSNCGAALKPALNFMDSQKLWTPNNEFAVQIFKIFMFSIQGQYSHVVVKAILDHLDHLPPNEVENKSSLLILLQVVVKIPSSSPIGPAVIEIFNQLYQNMETSVRQSTNQEKYHEAFIDSIGTLSEVLPEYQRIEAMVFFISKSKDIMYKFRHETPQKLPRTEELVLNMIFKSLLQIAKNYNESSLSSISSTLLEPLLKVSLSVSPTCRLLVQEIVLQLLDRRKVSSKIQSVYFPGSKFNIKLAEFSKHDIDFVERKLPLIFHWMYDILCCGELEPENFMLAYKSVCVILCSVNSPDVIIGLCSVMLTLQETALSSQNVLPDFDNDQYNCCVMSLVYAGMYVIAEASNITFLIEYVSRVLSSLEQQSDFFAQIDPNKVLLQKIQSYAFPSKIPEEILFSNSKIQDCLPSDSGFDKSRLQQPLVKHLALDGSSVDYSRAGSATIDTQSVRIEFPNTPEQKRAADQHQFSAHSITYDYFKKILSEPSPSAEEIKIKKEKFAEYIKNSTFEQIMSEVQRSLPEKSLRSIIENIDDSLNNEHFVNFEMTEKSDFSNIVFPSVCVL